MLALDHIVIAVPDLASATAKYTAQGFTVLPGGQHAAPRTSHNALIVLADGAYIELIAWRFPPPAGAGAEPWYDTLQADGEGLVDFALLPHTSTTAVIQAAQARGLHTLQGPFPGGRIRPDGQHIQWQTARHTTGDLPFLCGDLTPRDLRVAPDLPSRTHTNGALGINLVTVLVKDLDVSVGRYRALLGGTPEPVMDDKSATISLAKCQIQLVTETFAGLPDLPKRLRNRGEGPVAVGFNHQPPQAPETTLR